MLLFLASMEKIQLKIAEIMRGHHFPIINLWGFFQMLKGNNSAARDGIWLNFELIQALINVSCCSLQVWKRSN